MIYNGKRTCKRTDCLYYSPKVDYNGCDYCFLTGNLRGCQRGEECTKYRYATEQQRLQYRTEVYAKWEALCLQKYEMGLVSDDGETIP